MWWWFRKREHKRKKPSDDKWASLAASLKISFSQVREDINHLTTSDSIHHEQIEHLTFRVNKLESRIDSLLLALHMAQPTTNLIQEKPQSIITQAQESAQESTMHLI